jgi:hypothetical protein
MAIKKSNTMCVVGKEPVCPSTARACPSEMADRAAIGAERLINGPTKQTSYLTYPYSESVGFEPLTSGSGLSPTPPPASAAAGGGCRRFGRKEFHERQSPIGTSPPRTGRPSRCGRPRWFGAYGLHRRRSRLRARERLDLDGEFDRRRHLQRVGRSQSRRFTAPP